ncbi:hypothetical protein [Leptotrichia sp. oral taxon 847]|uniref:hypothetical protein n=1 Tax=Leptotrichia sp. oral taxon 847 TaxID=1785996 RepID=UPI00076835DB|nr:hypothetical protein [Leptotrichia sp. oral taxon 847]AMD95558.1 hypothetical protein AXF11_08205 [Leptotrichia sp. oral taxon 847]
MLSLVISQFGAANQDSLKKISFQSEWRNRYTDRTGDASNNLGNKGFKGSNRNRSRFRNSTSGTMKLSDEFDMDGNFRILRNQDVIYGKPSTRTSEGDYYLTGSKLAREKGEGWGINLNLY